MSAQYAYKHISMHKIYKNQTITGGVRGTTQTTPVPTNTTPTATATTHAAKRARQHSPPCHTAHAHHPPSTTSAPTPTNPTTSSFAAAFGPIVADASNADGSRYAGLAAGVEQARLDSVMQGLVEKDAVAEKMSSITTMQVSAWQCHTCRYGPTLNNMKHKALL